MKQRLKLLIAVGAVLPALAFSTVAAVEGTGSSTSPQPQTMTTTAVEDDDSGSTKTKTLQQRLDERKAQLKLKLTTVEQQRLQTKCKTAQGLLGALENRVSNISDNRGKVYDQLVAKLTDLQGKLKNQGVNTTDLEKQIETLKTKVTKFKNDMSTYKQQVADLSEMDCAKDPTAFKSTLELSRSLQKAIVQDAADIKTYVNDPIKPTLKKLRAQLAASVQKSDDTKKDTEGGTQ